MVLHVQALRRQMNCRIVARVACFLTAALFGWRGLPVHSAAFEGVSDEKERREVLVHYLPGNRRMKQTLTAAAQLQQSGRAAEALKSTQWILEQPFDVFLAVPGEPTKSVKQLAEERLRAFPPEWREQYERNYGAEARHLLLDAKRQGDESMGIRVLQRFATTTAANQVSWWLAWRSLDRGEARLALDLLLADSENVEQYSKLNSLQLFLVKSAAAAAANEAVAAAAGNELAQRSDPVALSATKRTIRIARAQNQEPPRDERFQTEDPPDDCPFSREHLTVLHPLWQDSLRGLQNSPYLVPVLNAWQSHLQERNLSPVVTGKPLVVRRQVVLRDYEGIRCLDLESGRLQWKFRCESSLSTWLDDNARYRQGQFDPAVVFSDPLTLESWISNNTQLNSLSSDGTRIYLIDSLPASVAGRSLRSDPFSGRPERGADNADELRTDETNRLLALEIPPREAGPEGQLPRLVWSLGPSGQANPPAEDSRYFFGPPAASGGRLYCVCEVDREQRLLALDAESGQILWEQPIAVADRSAVQDGGRAFASCTPVLSGGLALCPTQVGVLTAVDALTGRLRWAYFDGDPTSDPAGKAPGRLHTGPLGRPGFASRTIVRDERVLHFPTSSSKLHCLDRMTGRQIWTLPRQQACAIADVTKDLVVLLEDHACRAVRLSDGSDVWRTSLPALTGTGISLGSQLLLPLEQGRLALIELATGRNELWYPPRSEISLGNLVNCGPYTLSLGPEGISAFPQLQTARQMLKQPDSVAWTGADRGFLQAQMSLTEGSLDQAETSLDAVLSQRPEAGQLEEATGILRELQYEKLARQPGSAPLALARLERLAATPVERGRFLAQQARWFMDQEQAGELKWTLQELSKLPAEAVFPSGDDAEWKLSPACFCRMMLAELESRAPDVAEGFRQELLTLPVSREPPGEALRRMKFAIRACQERAEAAPLRAALVQNLVRDRRWHAAEVLALQNQRLDQPRPSAEAMWELVKLYDLSGWPRDAAPWLNRLQQRSADVTLPGGRTVRDWQARLPAASDLKQWQQRLVIPSGPVQSAAIHMTRNIELNDLDGSSRANRVSSELRGLERRANLLSRLIPSEPLAVELFVQRSPQRSEILAVDKSSSQTLSSWPMPTRFSVPMPNGSAFQGHFFPVGMPGELRGYSLLEMAEQEPAWVQRPAEIARLNATPSIGPGGPGFVVFQVRNHLFVCDPADGGILWQRSSLPADSGMYSDPTAGISGDEHSLTVFEQDHLKYTLYETFTGRVLRQGELGSESRQPRRAFGRKLRSVWQVRGQWEVRVWDPLENRWEFAEPLAERNHLAEPVIGTPETFWLTNDSHLKAYDARSGVETMNVAFPAEEYEGLSAMRVMNDGPRCYVNLQRHSPPAQTRDYNNAFRDVPLSNLTIRDDLYAIDRDRQRVLWKRTVPFRTLLKLEPAGLPFLVLLSQIRDARDSNQLSLLVEVLNAETGELIARREKLPLEPLDPIRHAEYDGVEQKVRLMFQRMTIEITLSAQASLLSPSQE